MVADSSQPCNIEIQPIRFLASFLLVLYASSLVRYHPFNFITIIQGLDNLVSARCCSIQNCNMTGTDGNWRSHVNVPRNTSGDHGRDRAISMYVTEQPTCLCDVSMSDGRQRLF